ncbi:hypothetical protein MTBSS4_240005 [Magnetospirillum sp. SS-4]|nr:hypothetical protein MTBSS4_240005 [Magnetospirillum sp. SS-4]
MILYPLIHVHGYNMMESRRHPCYRDRVADAEREKHHAGQSVRAVPVALSRRPLAPLHRNPRRRHPELWLA